MKRTLCYSLLFAVSLATAGNVAADPPKILLATLGGVIFADTNLSKNGNQSCMTCHNPSAAFVDPDNTKAPNKFPVSKGSIAGLFGGRNAPSAAYASFSPVFYYDPAEGLFIGGVFWDGRATGLTLGDPMAEQALGPFLNPVEMALPSKAAVLNIIKKSSYAGLFRLVFGPQAFANTDEAYNNVGRAISAFENTVLFNRFTSKFDKFWKEQGKDISQFGIDENFMYVEPAEDFTSKYFTRQEARGLALFNAENKGKCALCHLTINHMTADNKVYPPMFTDFTYDNLGVPVNPRIAELAGPQKIDYGLGARTREMKAANPNVEVTTTSDGVEIVASEIGKFKVPSLRNVGKTAPYAHNGYFATLERITHFYNTRDTETWPAPEVADTVNSEELGNLGLTPSEEADIVAFMKTLSD
jgi:cytochrome c peroxidase